jgi:uncharacterized phosphosugar-binding protein
MLAEEAFHRAGGLVPVNGLLLDWLMVHDPGRRAGPLERTSGLAAAIWHNEPLEANDVVIVASNSGINPAPVEVAEAARDRGATVVAITSRAHSMAVTPRTRNGMRLLDVADYVVDTHAPIGDACVALNGGQAVGASSSVLGIVALQSILVEAACELERLTGSVPIFRSVNLNDADAVLEQAPLYGWRGRVPSLLR